MVLCWFGFFFFGGVVLSGECRLRIDDFRNYKKCMCRKTFCSG